MLPDDGMLWPCVEIQCGGQLCKPRMPKWKYLNPKHLSHGTHVRYAHRLNSDGMQRVHADLELGISGTQV